MNGEGVVIIHIHIIAHDVYYTYPIHLLSTSRTSRAEHQHTTIQIGLAESEIRRQNENRSKIEDSKVVKMRLLQSMCPNRVQSKRGLTSSKSR